MVLGSMTQGFESILTPEALEFLSALHKHFDARRQSLLSNRSKRLRALERGERPNFLSETEAIRQGNWCVAPIPADLLDRRVEITGPVDRKMIINALNSGAKVFMADFEDSNSPSWDNNMQGQINLRDAINRTIEYTHPVSGKYYSLNDKTATLMVRPRG
ncbi:MAG: malate synthase A, partial [Bacteroidia bacterium]|nr:malate synthase A [Bacteroidia bacterium]